MKDCNKYIASIFDSLIGRLRNNSFDVEKYSIEEVEKINKIFEKLDCIKDCGDDERKELYFSIPKGNIDDYIKYFGIEKDNMDFYTDFDNYDEFENDYNDRYSKDVYWYKLVSTKYKGFRVISINNKVIVQTNVDETEGFKNLRIQELLDIILVKVDECIEMLKNNIYNDYVKNNISSLKRVGIIKRSDYMDFNPEERQYFKDNISVDDIKYFINDVDNGCNNKLMEMSANKYYECCYLSYKVVGYDVDGLCFKEAYLQYADGRDEGLRDINPDSSSDFDNWFNDRERFGGHPWEIIRGHSFNRINLQVCYDGGYYLALDGSVSGGTIDVLKIYLTLRRNNIPINLYYKDELKKYVLEEDYIGIVPEEVWPIKCNSYFPGEKLISFINLEDENDKIIDKVIWQAIDKVYLKQYQ